jgi:hypothetical protein
MSTLSSLGGSPVFIETAATPTAKSEGGGGVNVVTGQLGNVCPLPLPPHPSISPLAGNERECQHCVHFLETID